MYCYILSILLTYHGVKENTTVTRIPPNYLSAVEQQLDKRTNKALERFARQEKKMQAKLMKVDTTAAKRIFSQPAAMPALKNTNAGGAYLNTLQNSLQFLQGSHTKIQPNNQ